MVYAPDVWLRIVASAHRFGEPGVVFVDEVNRRNRLLNSMGPVVSCNPCGEQFLHAYNACNLASIDLSRFHRADGVLDWDRLRAVVWLGVRLLDNMIDVCAWPMPEIAETVNRTRPVGLGVMGFADLCLKRGIRYGSPRSADFMDEVMGFVRREAWSASLRLGQEKGPFPEAAANEAAYATLLDELESSPGQRPAPRNYQVTMAEPAATVAMVAETSSGIEPNFSWAHARNDKVGARTYVHRLAAEALGVDLDPDDENSIERAAELVLQRQDQLPEYFVTAHTISSLDHVRVLAAAQRNVDNGVSKTCNAPRNGSLDAADQVFRKARELGCKAVSYYRDGSREGQILITTGTADEAVSSSRACACE
jgi:ribonucleoside-diphosphate reductase alpha chain